MSRKTASTTLSDKISDLLTSVPKSFDPEDYVHEESVAKVVDQEEGDNSEDEVFTSKFRTQNIDLLEDVDKKYSGKQSSRKNLKEIDELSSEDEIIENHSEHDSNSESNSEYDSDKIEDESESDYHSDKIEEEEIDGDQAEVGEFTNISKDNTKAERGICVRNQLKLWESLLEMRIQLQKSLIPCNKLPQLETYDNYTVHTEFNEKVGETKQCVSNLLEKFLTLQSLFQKQFSETQFLHKKSQPVEEGDDDLSDSEEETVQVEEEEEDFEVPKKCIKLEDYEERIAKNNEKYSKYRDSVITKWYDKTKLASGKRNEKHSVTNQINFILNDKQKLLKRTHLKRSQYDVIGKPFNREEEDVKEATEEDLKPQEEYDTEIFDDDDFYHQLLRELIEFKSADLTDPVQLGRQWLELQSLRSKMKRKIDTKATKGRKIRYAVHSKLINFMAPVEENSSWTNEAKSELFSSLFGKTNFRSVNTKTE